MSDALALEVRAQLLRAPEGCYLNSAAEGLLLASHLDAWREYADLKSRGSQGRVALADKEEAARAAFGRLIGADSADVAFVASTSRGLDIAVKSIDWQPGDCLVTVDAEFPTTLFSAALLEERGVEIRTVAYRDGAVHESDIVTAIGPRTRLVVLSLVSFKTGQLLETDAICAAAHENGALVFVDAVQALGAVEVAVGGIDFLCAATFKWMLASHGVAGLYVSARARQLTRAPYVGYRSVTELFPGADASFSLHDDSRRFEEGMPNFPGILVLGNSLRFIEQTGIGHISEHNRALGARVRSGLRDLGIEYLCPNEGTKRSSIVAFETPRFSEVEQFLASAGITVWARDGRVRIAPHVYNTDSDIDWLLDQLSTVLP